jgi:hypothetical protein
MIRKITENKERGNRKGKRKTDGMKEKKEGKEVRKEVKKIKKDRWKEQKEIRVKEDK